MKRNQRSEAESSEGEEEDEEDCAASRPSTATLSRSYLAWARAIVNTGLNCSNFQRVFRLSVYGISLVFPGPGGNACCHEILRPAP